MRGYETAPAIWTAHLPDTDEPNALGEGGELAYCESCDDVLDDWAEENGLRVCSFCKRLTEEHQRDCAEDR